MHARVAASAFVIMVLLVCVFKFTCFDCDPFAPRSFSLLQNLGLHVASEPPHLPPAAVISAQAQKQLHPASSVIRHKVLLLQKSIPARCKLTSFLAVGDANQGKWHLELAES
jgi:hypothetical protein